MTPGDDLVWTGWFAKVARPMSAATVRAAATAIALLFVFAGAATIPFALGWVDLEGLNRGGVCVLGVEALVMCIWVLRIAGRTPDERMTRIVPSRVVFITAMAMTNMALVVLFTGPQFGVTAVYYAEVPVLAFFLLQRRWAIALSAAAMLGYAGALIALDGPPAPVEQFVILLSSGLASGVLIGAMASRIDDSRRAERVAKAELADLNQHLEARVTEQVDELERTRRLRRFLSPQIAEVVTSEGADEMLAPHRADIAAFFVDLRGFTQFTNAVTAERVMRVLDEYYAAVGAVLDDHGATIGGFDGDGVFAYLGDPVPHDDAAKEAITMAAAVARCLDRLTATWSDDDAPIGYGIGLAYGEATLGVVGFASRADYTPVGAVVNMAARLCADARHGEIVVDDALRKAAAIGRRARRRSDVDLKGFGVTKTFAVSH